MHTTIIIVALHVAAVLQPPPQPAPPPLVTPAPALDPVRPPSDAVVLFDGTGLDAWQSVDGGPASWGMDGKPDGAMTVRPDSGNIVTKRAFGDCQIHLEFATPNPATGEGQGRGNSGVYVQSRYEVQVLDSFQSETYPSGQCGAIYGQHPPRVNATRPPGEWQSFDIVFRAARFDAAGKKAANARMTVLHNGVLIHDHAEVIGSGSANLKDETGDAPLCLQAHGNPVRYRNIWVRPLTLE